MRISHEIFEILERFTPEIEPVSIDEAFLDITGSYHLFGSPIDTCRKIKNTVKTDIILKLPVIFMNFFLFSKFIFNNSIKVKRKKGLNKILKKNA